jgi:hypothetical protein
MAAALGATAYQFGVLQGSFRVPHRWISRHGRLSSPDLRTPHVGPASCLLQQGAAHRYRRLQRLLLSVSGVVRMSGFPHVPTLPEPFTPGELLCAVQALMPAVACSTLWLIGAA